jgi:hypothetical protein
MRRFYRDIEYDVHQLDDGRWEYHVFPKAGEGVHWGSTVDGDDVAAITRAKMAIDLHLGPRRR